MFGNSDTPIQISLQKSAKITICQERRFGNSDTPIELSLKNLVKIANQ